MGGLDITIAAVGEKALMAGGNGASRSRAVLRVPGGGARLIIPTADGVGGGVGCGVIEVADLGGVGCRWRVGRGSGEGTRLGFRRRWVWCSRRFFAAFEAVKGDGASSSACGALFYKSPNKLETSNQNFDMRHRPTERKRAHPSGDRHSAAPVVLSQDRTRKVWSRLKFMVSLLRENVRKLKKRP